MFGRKLGLVAVGALVLGLVLAAPAAQARKKVVTKTYQVGVERPRAGCRSTSRMAAGRPCKLTRDALAVKGLNPRGKIKDVNVGVRITHPFASDLEIYLATPRGVINLSHDVGGRRQQLTATGSPGVRVA